jgi:hypothetical protein
MNLQRELSTKLLLGLIMVGVVGFGTAHLKAQSCMFNCGDCVISLTDCDWCVGGCGWNGANCQKVCWECTNGDHGCS